MSAHRHPSVPSSLALILTLPKARGRAAALWSPIPVRWLGARVSIAWDILMTCHFRGYVNAEISFRYQTSITLRIYLITLML